MTVNDFTATKRGGPERKIKDVVQTKRAKHAQDKTVQQGAQIAGGVHQTAEAKDQLLEVRPDNGHERPDEYRRQRADNRNKARASKEACELRKRDFIKPMMQCAGHQSNNYPTKHARFKRLNAQRHALPCGPRIFKGQLSGQDQQGIDSGIHHQISE